MKDIAKAKKIVNTDNIEVYYWVDYQATNWLYTGLSSATPLYDIGDGVLHHSRSLAHELGSHSIRYLTSQGINARIVPHQAKHRYIYFLDKSWTSRLAVPELPYPKKEVELNGNS